MFIFGLLAALNALCDRTAGYTFYNKCTINDTTILAQAGSQPSNPFPAAASCDIPHTESQTAELCLEF